MTIEPLPLKGAFRIIIERFADERGFFARTFCKERFLAAGLETEFVQHSISVTRNKGTIRGLHYQAKPGLETKLIRCTRGKAFDVIVDLRKESPTFGQWHGEIISEQNNIILYAPAGCAHGLQTLEENTEIDYRITPAYRPECAKGLRWNDPQLAIAWPLQNPILSQRDQNLPFFKDISL